MLLFSSLQNLAFLLHFLDLWQKLAETIIVARVNVKKIKTKK
jgi:hypothetical protein